MDALTHRRLRIPKARWQGTNAYGGEQEEQLPHLPSSMGVGGARIALHSELFHLSYLLKGNFWRCRQLVQENFSGRTSPKRPMIVLYY